MQSFKQTPIAGFFIINNKLKLITFWWQHSLMFKSYFVVIIKAGVEQWECSTNTRERHEWLELVLYVKLIFFQVFDSVWKQEDSYLPFSPRMFCSEKYILVICRHTAFQPSNLRMYSSWIHFPEILGIMIEKVKNNSKISDAHSASFC